MESDLLFRWKEERTLQFHQYMYIFFLDLRFIQSNLYRMKGKLTYKYKIQGFNFAVEDDLVGVENDEEAKRAVEKIIIEYAKEILRELEK